jgi:hypothetical protein
VAFTLLFKNKSEIIGVLSVSKNMISLFQKLEFPFFNDVCDDAFKFNKGLANEKNRRFELRYGRGLRSMGSR